LIIDYFQCAKIFGEWFDMSMMDEKIDKKVGEFLVENSIISGKQLKEALDMQKDNPERLVGEILVTQGAISKEELIMALEMYLLVTGHQPEHVDEWLDQDEIDMLQDKIKGKHE
jgi:hypothetical protein